MRIVYEGGPRGLAMLAQALRGEGLDVDYEPPIEERGAGQDALRAVIHVTEVMRDEAVGAVVVEAARRAIAKVRQRLPGVKAKIEDD